MLNEEHQAPLPATPQHRSEKSKEWRLFIFIIVFLFPILTVAIVGALGFSIWFYQLIVGPPGPY
ncbi:periplasmic nitrate reductase, NapE protein [Cellvibrio sp. UBA7671]|uniref:periplasmic nitrate reductase, NapE protein n=1 Tax=Cellvibrio sp. UBA7671 TaxID=1946312 RepID=UPI002AB84FB5|nr:periplasmic nitrate reductase, NapE protein [Pseudomonadota bacterium]